jgi:hypothetical protein
MACLSQRRGQLQATIRWYLAKTVVERLLQLCSIFLLFNWKQSTEWTICTENIFSVAQNLLAGIDHGLFSLLLVFTDGLSRLHLFS